MSQDFTVKKKAIFVWKKKIRAEGFTWKKNSCKLKIPHPPPPITLTNGPSLTKQGFCKILWRKLRPRGSLLLEFIHSSGWGGGERLFEFDWEEEGVGAYSRLGAN